MAFSSKTVFVVVAMLDTSQTGASLEHDGKDHRHKEEDHFQVHVSSGEERDGWMSSSAWLQVLGVLMFSS